MLSAQQLRELLDRARVQDAGKQVCRRLEWFVYFVGNRQSVTATCRHFGISRSTFHRWINRFDPADLASLVERSHEPATLRQIDVAPRALELIRHYRRTYPQMGKERIAQVLRQDHGLTTSVSTVGRVIERECLYFGDTPLHWRKRAQHEQLHGRLAEPIQVATQDAAASANAPSAPALRQSPCHGPACPFCRLKRFNWGRLKSAALVASIAFNLALAGLMLATALLEGKPTNAAPANTELPGYEQPAPTSLLPQPLQQIFGIEHAEAAAGIYAPINYQGKLTDSGGVAIGDGSYNMRFKIFNSATGGVPLWTETWDNTTQRVTSTGGLFSIALGTHTAMTGSVDFNSDSLYLQVEFDPNNAGTYPEVFSPRRRFASVPYAHNADSLDGLDSRQFIRSDVSYTASGTLTISSRDNHRIGIDILSTAGATTGALRLSTQGAPAIVFGSGGSNYDTNLYRAAVDTLKTDGSFQVVGTLSGKTLNISGDSALSGSLLVKGNVATKGSYSGAVLTIMGGSSYILGNTAIGRTTAKATLDILGTASGTDIYAANSVSGSYLYAAKTFGGAGLASCDGSSSKLLYNSATKRFECGTALSTSTGALQTSFDNRYVNVSGDTMTGALTVNLSSGYLGLKVLQMESGSIIHAEKTLTSSGTILAVGNISTRGTLSGKTLTVMNGTSYLLGSVGIGTATPSSLLEVNGTAQIDSRVLAGAGSVGTPGYGFKDYPGKGMYTDGTNLLFANANNEALRLDDNESFLWNLNGSSARTFTIRPSNAQASNVFVFQQNPNQGTALLMTMEGHGNTTISPDASTVVPLTLKGYTSQSANLQEWQNTSGTPLSVVFASGALSIGSSTYRTALDVAGTMSGAALTVMNGTSYLLGSVGIGKTSPTAKLDVVGTISGSALTVNGNITPGMDGVYQLGASGSRLGDDYSNMLHLGNPAGEGMVGYNAVQKYLQLGVTPSTGSGKAATFTAGNYLNAADSNFTYSTQLSISFWVKVNSTSGNGAAAISDWDNNLGQGFYVNNLDATTPAVNFELDGVHADCSCISTGSWYHVVTVFNGTQTGDSNRVKIYVNGVSQSVTFHGSMPATITKPSGQQMQVGLWLSDRTFANSYLDAMGIWDRALTASEVNALYNNGKGIPYWMTSGSLRRNLMSWWDFEEASGTTRKDSHGTNDLTNHGTVGVTGGTVQDGTATNQIAILQNGNVGIGTTSPMSRLYVAGSGSFAGTMSGRSLVVSGTGAIPLLFTHIGTNRVGIGTTSPKAKLDVVGTISGSALHASDLITSSGSLVVQQNLTVHGSLSGSTFFGSGLGSCNGTSQKLTYNPSTGKFGCATDQTGAGGTSTGSLQAAFDNRYVNVSGDTMTGALTINLSSGFLGLKILQTGSGNYLHAEKGLSSSGTLAVNGSAFFKGALSGNTLHAEKNITASGAIIAEGNIQTKGTLSGENLIVQGTGSLPILQTNQNQVTVNGTIENGLLRWYTMDTLSGSSILDSSINAGRASSGSFVGSPTLTTGKLGRALSFNGSNYVSLQSLGSTPVQGTISYWMRPTVIESYRNPFTTADLTGTESSNNTIRFEEDATGLFEGVVGNGPVVNGFTYTSSLQANTWYHVVLTWNTTANTVTGYFNGTKVFSAANTVWPSTLSTPTIGAGFSTAREWKGQLDDFRIYSRQLSAREVADLYRWGSANNGGTMSGVVVVQGNLNVNGILSGSVLSTTTINDLSGNARMTILNNGNVGIGTQAPKAKLSVVGTISGSALKIDNNADIFGRLSVSGSILTKGTLSGANLIVSGASSFSGAALFGSSVTTKNSFSGSSFFGSGLGSCSGSNQKLLYNPATGKFGCGTDQTGGGSTSTGSLQAAFDNRYVNVSGDTMTGALTINLSSGFLGLKILQTGSGNYLHAEKGLSSSGTLAVNGSAYFKGTLSGNTIHTEKNLTVSGAILSEGTISGRTLIVSGVSSFSGASTYKSNLTVEGTLSGQSLRISAGGAVIQGALSVSGSVLTKGTLSGENLIVSGASSFSGSALFQSSVTTKNSFSGSAIFGLGLGDCSNTSTSKVIYNATTGKFGCATDQSGGSGTFGTGNVLTLTDNKFVHKQGDTMTGALTINLSSGFLGLKILQTASGNVIHAEKGLTSSGEIVVSQSTVRGSGALVLTQRTNSTGAYFTSTATGAPLLVLNSSGTSRTPQILFGYHGRFDVALWRSGTGILTVSGSLLPSKTNTFDLGSSANRWRDLYLSGGTLHLGAAGNESVIRFNTSASRFGIDANADGTNELSILSTGNVGIGTQTPKAKLSVLGTISGSALKIDNNADVSGRLNVSGSILTKGTLSGENLIVSGVSSFSGTALFASSVTTKSSFSGSSFYGSGLGSCNGATSKLLYDPSTGKFSCGTDQTAASGMSQTDGDLRYVRQSGDTMTGALTINLSSGYLGLKILQTGSGNYLHAEKGLSSSGTLAVNGSAFFKGTLSGSTLHAEKNLTVSGSILAEGTISGRTLIVAGVSSFSGASTFKSSLTVKGTLSGQSLRISAGGAVIQGPLSASGTIQTKGTLSGENLIVSGVSSFSGASTFKSSLTAKGTISGGLLVISGASSFSGSALFRSNLGVKGNLSGSSFYGAGLGTCNGSTQKLLYDPTTGKFSCGTDQTAASGMSQTDGDLRYVKKSGDTMTGALTINLSSGFIGLKILQTASGNSLHAEKGLSSSGTLAVNGSAYFKGTLSGNTLHAEKNLTVSGSILTEGTISGRTLIIGGFSSFSGASTFKSSLTVKGALSGQSLRISAGGGVIQGALSTSGTILTKGTLSGENLIVSGVSSFSGASTFKSTLTVKGTLSGELLLVSGASSFSGSALFKSSVITKTSFSGSAIFGLGLGDCSNTSTSKVIYNATTGKFGCATDQNTGGTGSNFGTGNVLTLTDNKFVHKQGDTMTGALTINLSSGFLGLKILQTASGNTLHAEKGLSSSGTLAVNGSAFFKGALSGNTLHAEKNITASGAIIAEGTLSGRTLIVSGVSSFSGASTFKSTLQVSGTGSKPLFFTSNAYGGVGLGTTTPTQLLTVSGGSMLDLVGGTPKALSGVNIGGTDVTSIAIAGKYAYVGVKSVAGSDLRIIDVGNPNKPQQIGGVDFGTGVNAVAVAGKYVYAGLSSNAPGNDLRIVDVSNPASPRTLSGANFDSGVNGLAVDGKYAYVALSTVNGNDFRIVDVGNPNQPRVLSGIDLYTNARAVAVQGRYAYVGTDSVNGNDVRIIDISKPQAPVIVGGVDVGTSVRGIAVSGRYMYVVNAGVSGTCSGSTVTGCEFRIYDVSNPASPAAVGGYSVTSLSTEVLKSVFVAGNYAYVGGGTTTTGGMSTNDIRILNIQNASAPVEVGSIEPNASVAAITVAGKYLYAGLGNGDGTGIAGTEFTIYDLPGIDAPSATIGTLGLTFLNVSNDAVIDNILSIGNALNVGIGGIKSDGALSVIVGSGSSVNNLTGALIVNRSSSGVVLALDSYAGNGTGASVIHPQLLFGYRGQFDTNLYRSGTGTLATSGSLLITGGTGRVLQQIYSHTTVGSGTVMEMYSDVNNGLGNVPRNRIFRFDADGNAYADRSWVGGGADYAERFLSSTSDFQPGEAACLDPLKQNAVKRCDRDGDPNIMGIISTKPAFVGDKFHGADADGKNHKDSAIVGLIGQLPAKAVISGQSGAINVGDALAAAASPGFIRKAKPGESTVGVALTPLATGTGTIDVLITRRNQSDLVAQIDQQVAANIASLNIGDQINQMVQSSLLNANIDSSVAQAVQTQLSAFNLTDQVNAAIDARLGSLSDAVLAVLRTSTAALLLPSDLTVSGALLVQRDATVSGTLHAAALDVPGLSVLNGTLSAGPLSVSGATFSIGSLTQSGSLQVIGSVTVQGLASFLGDVEVRGTFIVGNNQAGYAIMPALSTAITVHYGTGFADAPVVNVTPNGRVGSEWWIDWQTATGFTIRADKAVTKDVRFGWTAIGVRDARTASGSVDASQKIAFHVDAQGRPYSLADSLWNSCIRDPNSYDLCRGYHQGTLWFAHPDIVQANEEVLSFTFDPAASPSLTLPDSYVPVVVDAAASSSFAPAQFQPEPASNAASSQSSVSSSETSAADQASQSSATGQESSASSQSSQASSQSSVSSSESSSPSSAVSSSESSSVSSEASSASSSAGA